MTPSRPTRGLSRNRRPSGAAVSGFCPEFLQFLLQPQYCVNPVLLSDTVSPQDILLWGDHPDWATSGYSLSGGHPDRPSGTSLPEGDTILSFRTEKGSLARGTPQGPLPSHRSFDVCTRHHPITSSAFASNRLWDGWSGATNPRIQ